MHFNDTKNLSLAQVVSVNGLTIYPFSFKYSRNYFHKSCFIFKTRCDYWRKIFALVCKCSMKAELTTQHLMKDITETCGTINDKAIFEMRFKCNWLNSELYIICWQGTTRKGKLSFFFIISCKKVRANNNEFLSIVSCLIFILRNPGKTNPFG